MPLDTATAAVAVDLVALTILDDELCVRVAKRQTPPFRDHWALPGRLISEEQDLFATAELELARATGLAELPVHHIEQLAAYGDPRRDPRGRVVSIAYLALVAGASTWTHTPSRRWAAVSDLLEQPAAASPLAFDHREILADGVARTRAKLEYTPLAGAFCPETFTVSELRHVYEVVWGVHLDPRNFHRKATSTPGFLAPTGSKTTRDGGRPAELYRTGDALTFHPPLTRHI